MSMLKTLMVEDNDTFRETFKGALLKQFPFMVLEEAVDGTGAFDKIKSFLPDLVFLDIRLPGESGLELTEKIKARYPEIVVVILTDYDLPEYREAAFHGGADDFIPKGSLNLSEIAALIESTFPDRDLSLDDPAKQGWS
jgi:DNA-binding NarL/FixJ family response regulator